MSKAYFISGIDTDAGKTYVTGHIARHLMKEGKRVITQKFIQTGNAGMSEDIEVHRRIMGTGMLPEDLDHTTAPVIFSYPASAQLAARIDGREIDLGVIDRATERLLSLYDVVLVEGAGGLAVPITDTFMAIDYVESRRLPLILVTNGVLGSINHTVLSLEAVRARGIELAAVIYNEHFDTDAVIAADTRGFIERYVKRNFPDALFATVPSIEY
ncbi:dethiobiotin synthase [uncultured Duncaniella sp.]|uniref:dethiobiotin synthase n=1 Tax=uncultured Duncaniella sp. TaxID=2768039 RepID=UPI0026750B45|nr:dethiobiotin synthase [uncultured Duncaniella sp.]MCI9171827.1 ATP-dependent dethiobiotin synthetase BioD [Muribaculaceae bacterium]